MNTTESAMNPTTIHDLPAAWRADPHANAEGCARQLEEMLPALLQNERELGDLRFVMEQQWPWNAKAQAMLDPGRWAGRNCIEFAVTELEEARARIAEMEEELAADLRAMNDLAGQLTRRDQDVAELTGRLRERTDAMLERQVELRDEARQVRRQRDTLAACLKHLRECDWFRAGTTGDVVCKLDADRVRDALNSIDASPTAPKCGQSTPTE